jgi:PadR family transcriptional regulator AphA
MSRCTVPTSPTNPRALGSTTSYALLGLLSIRSWTTYELAKQVQRSLNWFWPRAERKLYDEPKALVAAGLAVAGREYTGQRPRTVYDITPAGREALTAWLNTPSAPRTTEFEAMLKVFFADSGSLEQLEAVIDAIAQSATDRLAALRELAESGRGEHPAFPERLHISALTLPLQLEQEAAVLRWARWAREQVHSWRTALDPGDWQPREVLAAMVANVDDLLGG